MPKFTFDFQDATLKDIMLLVRACEQNSMADFLEAAGRFCETQLEDVSIFELNLFCAEFTEQWNAFAETNLGAKKVDPDLLGPWNRFLGEGLT